MTTAEISQLLFDEEDEVLENIFRQKAFAVWTLTIQPGVKGSAIKEAPLTRKVWFYRVNKKTVAH